MVWSNLAGIPKKPAFELMTFSDEQHLDKWYDNYYYTKN